VVGFWTTVGITTGAGMTIELVILLALAMTFRQIKEMNKKIPNITQVRIVTLLVFLTLLTELFLFFILKKY
jgi:1,4-dihydroxy-2-naphthoate octaprenyltransferase